MLTLRDQFRELSSDQKRIVHLVLCEHALSQWREFCASRGRITYAERVCGTRQRVDSELPADAFQSAQQGRDIANVDQRYGEPIAAMQDDDLTFPEAIEYAYYALYNVFSKYAGKEDVDDWLIVNQAVASETDESKWHSLLHAAIQGAM